MNRLEGKIALITGAARGIGKACAEVFAKEGAFVYLTDIDDELGSAAAQEIGANAHYFHQDVENEEEWKQTIEKILKEKGKLDILVNNAGITGLQENLGPQNPEETALESWRKIHAINLDSTFLGCKYGIQAMKNGQGSIINISSRSGMVGIPTAAAYASSKAAIRNHTKSVALYCCDKGYKIRCNSLHPAAILTPIWDPMLGTDKKEREKAMKAITDGIPMKKMGDPEDVAYAALFLASEEAKYITGTELTIDGGILAGSSASPHKD